jgi:hypothetical protein
MPALLPPDPASAESPDELVDRIDAVVLGGGPTSIPTARAPRHTPKRSASPRPRPIRDRSSAGGARSRDSAARRLPRDADHERGLRWKAAPALPERLGHHRHRPTPGEWAEHEVRLAPGSLASRASGGERLTIKTHITRGSERSAGASSRRVGPPIPEPLWTKSEFGGDAERIGNRPGGIQCSTQPAVRLVQQMHALARVAHQQARGGDTRRIHRGLRRSLR